MTEHLASLRPWEVCAALAGQKTVFRLPGGAECPFSPGDTLVFQETWRPEERVTDMVDGIRFAVDGAFIPIENTFDAADRWCETLEPGLPEERKNPWHTPVSMPSWAARLRGVVANVRSEPLRMITGADACREGWTPTRREDVPVRERFAEDWDEQHGAGSWERNDLVWRVEFALGSSMSRERLAAFEERDAETCELVAEVRRLTAANRVLRDENARLREKSE